jgi:hypothetical protein
MPVALLGIDNKVDPLYILLPNSELGKSCSIKVGELLLAGFQRNYSCNTSNAVQ